MKRIVNAADGTELALEEGGNPHGKPIVFLHGIAQSRHAWRPLFESALSKTHRLIAVDLRGHGDSGAPTTADAYGPGKLGDDVRAVIEGLDHPTIVAWSYGGVALGEYLRAHGDAKLGGIVLVAAATAVGKPARAFFGPAMMDNVRALMAEDPAAYEAGARAFIAAASARAVDGAEALVEAMLRVPAHARRALLMRSEDFSAEFAASKVPLAIIQGDADLVVLPALARQTAAARPDATFTTLEGVGHAAWHEAPEEFGAALSGFVNRADR